ncbi:unnamed protein product, partial [Rotaria sordida]
MCKLGNRYISEDSEVPLAAAAFGPTDGYRFVIDGTQLDLEHEDKFNEQKSKITDDKTIFVLGRLRGGGFIDIATFIDIIYADLP